jgi:NodT family efflux transporter outer membrane factor (OMF) lipoprotein
MKRIISFRISLALAAVALSACAVGPDFRRPEPPDVKNYTENPLPDQTAASPGDGGAAQQFIYERDIPAEWWTLFQSKALDQLIRGALSDSPTVSAAQARLREAREEVRADAGGALVPNVDGNLSAKRSQFTGASFGQPSAKGSLFNLFNASVNVTYALDVFGGARRGLEALKSQAEYEQYQLEGAYLALTANIVTAAVKEASLREQIRATQEILAAQEKELEVIERQFEMGGVSKSDVLVQRTQVAQTRASLPPLELELARARHQLAALAGRFPSESSTPEFNLDGLKLPEELPVSLPSEMVRRRPDILASEAQLHEASAKIGVATANLFPQINLTGSYGSQASRSGDLFTAGSGIWSIGAGLLQPLFRGGELTHKRRAALAAYDAAAAQYRQTVLLSFQNVADVLRALEADARTLQARSRAEASAREALDLAEQQLELGGVSVLTLLEAQRQFHAAQASRIQAQADRYADTAALFQALGGGWWNRTPSADVPESEHKE